MDIITRAQQLIKLPTKENGIWCVEYVEHVRWIKQEFDTCDSAWAYYYSKLRQIKENIGRQGKIK